MSARHHPFLSAELMQTIFDIYRGFFLFYSNKQIFQHDLLLAILISFYACITILNDSSNKKSLFTIPCVPALLLLRQAVHVNLFASIFLVQISLHFTTLYSTCFTKNSVTFANFMLDLSIIELSFGSFRTTWCGVHG